MKVCPYSPGPVIAAHTCMALTSAYSAYRSTVVESCLTFEEPEYKAYSFRLNHIML